MFTTLIFNWSLSYDNISMEKGRSSIFRNKKQPLQDQDNLGVHVFVWRIQRTQMSSFWLNKISLQVRHGIGSMTYLCAALAKFFMI